MKPDTETDEWLATMRSAWKAGIDRDERQASAPSARRLARAVAPAKESPSWTLGDFLAVAVCVAACALGGSWLRHTMTAPRAGAIHEILADRAQEAPPTATAAAEPPPPLAAASSASPATSTRPLPAAPAKAKSETEVLPPLPRPTPSNGAIDDRTKMKMKMKRFDLRIERNWRRCSLTPTPDGLPPPLPPAHVRSL